MNVLHAAPLRRHRKSMPPAFFKRLASPLQAVACPALDSQERDVAAWQAARTHYKALGPDGAATMATEMPDTHIGVLCLMWLKQVAGSRQLTQAVRRGHDVIVCMLHCPLLAHGSLHNCGLR
jgi:hypothetical protein